MCERSFTAYLHSHMSTRPTSMGMGHRTMWQCSQLPGWLLLPRHRRPPNRLRSADTLTLLVSRTRTNLGDRAFSATGPRVWNNLPMDFRQTAGLVTQPFWTVAEGVFIRTVSRTEAHCEPPPRFKCNLEILLLNYSLVAVWQLQPKLAQRV